MDITYLHNGDSITTDKEWAVITYELDCVSAYGTLKSGNMARFNLLLNANCKYFLHIEDEHHVLQTTLQDENENNLNISWQQTVKGWSTVLNFSVETDLILSLAYNSTNTLDVEYMVCLHNMDSVEFALPKISTSSVSTNSYINLVDDVYNTVCGTLNSPTDMDILKFDLAVAGLYAFNIMDVEHVLRPVLLDENGQAVKNVFWQQTLDGWYLEKQFESGIKAYIQITWDTVNELGVIDYMVESKFMGNIVPVNFSAVTKTLQVAKDEKLYIKLRTEDVPTNCVRVEMGYDPEILNVCDMAAQDYEVNVLSGDLINLNVSVVFYDENAGKIMFEINSNVADEYVFGGALTIVSMEAMADGNTDITLTAI